MKLKAVAAQDGGDCLCPSWNASECCPAGYIVDCSRRECVPAQSIGDGACDDAESIGGHFLDCAELNFDGGDCADLCYTQEVIVDGNSMQLQRDESWENIFLEDDELSPPLEIGFEFTFYRATYSTVRISSNGFVSFDSRADRSCCEGAELPDSNYGSIIAPYWSDIDPSAGGEVLVKRSSDGVFVVRFDRVPHATGYIGLSTWQLQLYPNGSFLMVNTSYHSVLPLRFICFVVGTMIVVESSTAYELGGVFSGPGRRQGDAWPTHHRVARVQRTISNDLLWFRPSRLRIH